MSTRAAAQHSRKSVALAVLAFRRLSRLPNAPPLHAAHPSSALLPHESLNNSASSSPFLTGRWTFSRCSAAPAEFLRLSQPARRQLSSFAAPAKDSQRPPAQGDNSCTDKPADLEVSEYWGVAPKQIQRKDGSPWPWHCFKPADTYTADMEIDMERHYSPEKSWVDKLAYWTVRALRGPVDLFFKDRHVSHALLLETVAAVPGMVGGMLLHLRSLRRFEHSGGWIKTLLDEAENERMHLMTWVEVLRPAWWERALVLAVQGTFFNAYFVLYLASPRLAHRFVGYLEEEAVRSYTDFLEAIDAGNTPNGPAPLIAIDYWRLPAHATIRDAVLVIRADEAHHRDVNHFAADVYNEKRELRKSPAPIGYH